MRSFKLAIIGGGVMGEVLIKRVVETNLLDLNLIVVTDIRNDRLEYLVKKYGVRTCTDNCKAVSDSEAVIFSVKPQNISGVLEELTDKLSDKLVISIAAGISLGFIGKKINHNTAVVRAMTNTPASIGQGMTVWMDNGKLSEEQLEIVGSIFETLGEQIHVDNEKYLDMATAVSGTGPAYVFEFMEALRNAGVYLGLPHDLARKMVIQTLLGAVHLAWKNKEHFAQQRDKVTSPGGTSSRALAELDNGGFRTAIRKAVISAHDHSVQLGE